MRILVTGAAGFIGSHIANWYSANDYEVFGIDTYVAGSYFPIDPTIKMYPVDIRDRSALATLMKMIRPDIVNHHAALIDPRISMERPIDDTETNYIGTINVVDSSILAGCEKLIFASSCAVYGDIGAAGNMLVGMFELPNCPYGISKLASEKYIRVSCSRSDLSAVIMRYPNVYGSFQRGTRSTGVIAIFAHEMAKGNQIVIYGDGTAQYQYCYVDDIVMANKAAEDFLLDTNNKFLLANIPGTPASVNDVANMLTVHFPNYDKCPRFEKPRQGEQYCITMGGNEATTELKWEPHVDLTEGIARVAEAAKATRA